MTDTKSIYDFECYIVAHPVNPDAYAVMTNGQITCFDPRSKTFRVGGILHAPETMLSLIEAEHLLALLKLRHAAVIENLESSAAKIVEGGRFFNRLIKICIGALAVYGLLVLVFGAP